MERNKTITPAQFVETWLPDYKSRYVEWRRMEFPNLPPRYPVRNMMAYSKWCVDNLPEALAAFEAHIRQETWREACEAQRMICSDVAYNAYRDGESLHGIENAVYEAPTPEIPKNKNV